MCVVAFALAGTWPFQMCSLKQVADANKAVMESQGGTCPWVATEESVDGQAGYQLATLLQHATWSMR
jgi:hypothetical protein